MVAFHEQNERRNLDIILYFKHNIVRRICTFKM